ncbi:SPASM domain-containing protein [Desulfovibrio sp. OttesenSCG-928-G15]|nr:SPASM domain-containing protein [Desulfovibrio sp. OttesenSCG-928-G15]
MENTGRKKTGSGLIIYEDRWKKEGTLLRRMFPRFASHLDYWLKGMTLDKKHRGFIDSFMQRPDMPLFSHIELETHNRCNGTCAFCGVNRNAPQRPYARMTEALYEAILAELSGLHFRGSLSLHSNNEPLLDKRLPDFAAEARKRLPKAKIRMFTNGTLLTLDLYRKILPSFDRIFINNYAPDAVMHSNVREIHDFCRSPEGEKLLEGKTLIIQLRDPNVVLSSRGGSAPNREAPARPIRALCRLPFKQFIIRPDGGVSLCCNDALGKVTLGTLGEQSMLEVWQGKKATAMRRAMVEKGRAAIPLCALCDFVK